MAFKKTKEKYKRKAQALAATSKDLSKGTKEVAEETIDAVKGFKKLPWKKLPLEGWLYIGLCIVIIIVAAFFIHPYI